MTEQSALFSGTSLQKKWFKTADKRIIGQYLQKFVAYNSSLLEFIGVTPFIVGSDQSASIAFRTSAYIGSVPLRSPDTGKQIGDFVVTPRFTGRDRFAEYIDVINLLGNAISPEFVDSLPLISGRNFRPPLYLEAIKFIAAIELLVSHNWRKFDRQTSQLTEPLGQVDWRKYVQEEYKVENRQLFPVGRSILSEYHREYAELRHVFDLCKAELESPNTPLSIKLSLRTRLSHLEEKLYFHLPRKTDKFQIRDSDPPYVKACKVQANKILQLDLRDSTAWRVDFADAFEKFTQYIFKELAKELGGQVFENPRVQGKTTKHFAWQLAHLEPDGMLRLGELTLFFDAKYKSHLYNKYDPSELLKSEHRHDLHQILAYSAFSKTEAKHCFLCYPSSEPEVKAIRYDYPSSSVVTTLYICGLPFRRESLTSSKEILIATIDRIARERVLNASIMHDVLA